jgi:hypothetical protein
VPIRNLDRIGGSSHYGIGRTFNVMFDILTIRFLLTYFTRPMHFFGRLGLLGTSLGGLMLGFVGIKKLLGQEVLYQHGPLMIFGGILLLAGLLMFSTGLLGEMMMRTYFESQGRRIYAVREIRSRQEEKTREGNR